MVRIARHASQTPLDARTLIPTDVFVNREMRFWRHRRLEPTYKPLVVQMGRGPCGAKSTFGAESALDAKSILAASPLASAFSAVVRLSDRS